MKIARFSSPDEDPRFGVVDGDDLVVLAGDPMYAGYATTGERVPMSSAKILAPVIPRSKVIGVGLNFYDQVDEAGKETPEFPLLFLKPNTTVIGPGDAIQLPPVEGDVVLEGELAVVIGSIAKKVRAEDFADVVFGYTIANDVTSQGARDADGNLTRAKAFDTFCPLGPYIETELDWSDVLITSRIDGEVQQRESTQQMIRTIPDLVAYVSDIFTLLPGDVILTGTPAGVAPISAGQTVEIAVDGIGSLINPVRSRD